MSPAIKHVEKKSQSQTRQLTPVQKRKVKKRGLYSLQGLIGVSVFGVFGLLLGQLVIDAQINELHYEIERKKIAIDTKAVENEELYSKISELSTYSRAMEIAKQNGLSTHENIINIGE